MALRIIAYTSTAINGQVLLSNSESEEVLSDKPAELLDFLGEDFSDLEREEPYRELKVSWDLDVFVSVLLKVLGLKVCKDLIQPAHECLFKVGYDGSITLYDITTKTKVLPDGVYDIFYVPSKVFGLQVGEHKSYIYHLAQYYEDEPEETEPIAIHAKASIVIDAFRAMGLNPYKLTSPVAVYETTVLNHMDIPTILDLPKSMTEADANELIEWAEMCLPRDWLEAHAVGRWEKGESFDFDLQSAFGFHLSQLYNIRYAKFAKTKNWCPEAHEGLVKGIVTINPDVKVSPIVRNDNGNISCPVGCSWEDVRLLSEIRFIDKWKIGSFKLDCGWFWKYTAPVRPFEIPLQRVFELRSKQGMTKKLAKRVSASVWAKLIQNRIDGVANKHYNPIMATQVKTNCRLQVAEFIYANDLQSSLIHVGIDGVRTESKVHIEERVRMGLWKLNEPSACLVLSPGRVYTSDKKPQGLYYDDIIRMITEKPRESCYTAKLQRRQTLAECVEMGSLKGLGVMRDTSSTVDLNILRMAQDRHFAEFPRTGAELLERKFYSQPIALDGKPL